MNNRTCLSCHHFDGDRDSGHDTIGRCHRFPPVPTSSGSRWPEVLASAWCGEFAPLSAAGAVVAGCEPAIAGELGWLREVPLLERGHALLGGRGETGRGHAAKGLLSAAWERVIPRERTHWAICGALSSLGALSWDDVRALPDTAFLSVPRIGLVALRRIRLLAEMARQGG